MSTYSNRNNAKWGREQTGQTAPAVESVFPNASSSTNVEGSKSVYDDDECGSSNKSWIGQWRHWRKTSPCQLSVLSVKRPLHCCNMTTLVSS